MTNTETPGIGHNGPPADATAPDTGGIAAAQLRAFIDRIERLEEEKKTISDDIRDVYSEAKANGFDAPTLRAIVRLRKQDAAERQEREALQDLYLVALGMRPSGGGDA